MLGISKYDDITKKLFLILVLKRKNYKGVKNFMGSFFYEVEHFYKNGGPSWTITMQFPEEMRGEVESYFSNGRTIKETDSDWELGQQWEQQYFYKKG